jgi:hypothetical protein
MIAQNDIVKPALGQQTEQQYGAGRGLWGGSAFSGGVGAWPGVETSLAVTGTVGGVWPGWASLLWGTYATYRAMARHPTIAKATSDALAPVIGSQWLVDADEDAPKDATDWITTNIIAKRNRIIAHAVRSVIMGNAPFEVVWAVEAGEFVVKDFVPLLPDATNVMRERNGRGPFAGLQNGQAKLAPAECLYILNRSDAISDEPGDDYGRSRYENFRDTAWTGWLDSARKLAELEDRISGVVPVIITPTGAPANGPRNTDGTATTYAQMAAAVLPSLCHARSQGIVLETPAIGDVDADATPNKLKQLTTTVDTLDMGNRAASQMAMLAHMQDCKEMMAEGMYRSARTMMATEGGTKADATVHGDIQQHDPEATGDMIAAQINEQTVRAGLTLNFGPDILTKVRGIKATPLVDEDAQRATNLMGLMVAKDSVASALAQVIDWDKMLDAGHVPAREGVSFVDVFQKALADAAKTPLPGEPGGPVPPANQPGSRMSPRVARAVRTVTR